MKPYKRKPLEIKEPLQSAYQEDIEIKLEIQEAEYMREVFIEAYEESRWHHSTKFTVKEWVDMEKWYQSYWGIEALTKDNMEVYPNAWEAYKLMNSKLWKVLS